LRILFTSLSCLIDPGSGVAISVRTILRSLAARGHEVTAFSGACFDTAPKPSAVDMLSRNGFTPDGECWRYDDGPVRHLAMPFHTTQLAKVDRAMIAALTQTAARMLDDIRPDIVISYGATPYETAVRSMAQQKGAASVFYLAHPGYKEQATFATADLVVTDSVATQDLYRARMGLDSLVIGKFIAAQNAPRPARQARHVTFVNPSYQKGVTLFFRIAEMMISTLPSLKFLVVESRTNLDEIEQQSGLPFAQMRNIRRIGLQADMAQVFGRTHVLLMPSLWHESGGRTAIEALSCAIPVVSANHGGLPEHLGDGAERIDVPQALRDDPRLIPPSSVALPWVNAIARLWTEPDHWAARSHAAALQWERHDPTARIAMLETVLLDLTRARA
jgi:glycosyltransferase involved in cell wall biosynthesis